MHPDFNNVKLGVEIIGRGKKHILELEIRPLKFSFDIML